MLGIKSQNGLSLESLASFTSGKGISKWIFLPKWPAVF